MAKCSDNFAISATDGYKGDKKMEGNDKDNALKLEKQKAYLL